MPTAEYYALEKKQFDRVVVLGTGKSAIAVLGKKGPLLRVFRITNYPPFHIEDVESHFKDVQHSISRSHALAKAALRLRVPRAIDIFVVRNKRDKPIAVATVMEFIKGESLADELEKDTLTLTKLRDLATVFRMLWSHRLSHGDAVASNIIYNSQNKRYVLIDIDNIRQHKSRNAAKWTDMGMLQAVGSKIARYISENVTFDD